MTGQLLLIPASPAARASTIWSWCAAMRDALPADPRAEDLRARLDLAARRGLSVDEAIEAGVKSISLRRVIAESQGATP